MFWSLFLLTHCVPAHKTITELTAVYSTREHLDRTIQSGGGTSGHSSVEDSVATLDLVKWFVLNKKTKPYTLAGFPDDPRPAASGSRPGAMTVGTVGSVAAAEGVETPSTSASRSGTAVADTATLTVIGAGPTGVTVAVASASGTAVEGQKKKRPLFDDWF